MSHPVHRILMRFLGSEQFAFDANDRELFPSERMAAYPHDVRTDGSDDTQDFTGIYRELEPQS